MAANLITSFRLLLVGVFAYFSLQRAIGPAVATFTTAWALDALDGLVARSLEQETRFGYLFDKVVDRLLIMGGVLLLVSLDLIREPALWLLAGNFVAAPALAIQLERKQPMTGMGGMGKVLTFAQGAAVIWLLLRAPAAGVVIVGIATYGSLAGGVHLYRVLYHKEKSQRE